MTGTPRADLPERLRLLPSSFARSIHTEAAEVLEAQAAEIARLRELVGDAMAQFQSYAAQHWAKGTPEADAKAAVNEGWAARCHAALVSANRHSLRTD